MIWPFNFEGDGIDVIFIRKTQVFGRSSLDNHVIYNGQIYSLQKIMSYPKWASNGNINICLELPLNVGPITCQLDIANVVLTPNVHVKNIS